MAQDPVVELGSCISGIPVRVHYTYFLLLALMMISSVRYNDSLFLLLTFLLYGPIMLITIIIHEFGHAITTQKLGGTVDSIILWPLGGIALCSPPNDKGPLGDLKVAIAGPLTHIPQILIWLAILAIAVSGDFSNFTLGVVSSNQLNRGVFGFITALAGQSIVLNIALMIFNLFIPAYPLDGGRVLASTLLINGVPAIKAALITSVTAIVIALALCIYGIYSFFANDNPNGLFTIFIAIFIFNSSYKLFILAKSGNISEHPLFGRECYSNSNIEIGNNRGSGDVRCVSESEL